ncbi:putative zinc-containing alcohol dehydrogenase [Tetragenococcus halophilus subsp. halophilus]|nr:alcohol dehydrogenase catalytic domain-containing protein [Tetragenococcus halophilus]GBD73889.1 putative zinc-containing alcohol dehydrogenase [Tetragenococcus halophilus subsp. halophilus]GBD76324.1 putative zinc-containing alcohol dehydrogenase [Tetragenococcus halophilus subsp. halophilus]
MRAVQLYGKENMRINNIEKPQINENEILLKIKAASLCGTDVRMYKNGATGIDEHHPLTLGHEISGIIEKWGIMLLLIK